MKNYSDLIKSKTERTLTAKGYKFLWKCIDVIAMQNNVNRYSKEIGPMKEKFSEIIHHLIIDRGMTLDEIKDAIKNREIKNTLS